MKKLLPVLMLALISQLVMAKNLYVDNSDPNCSDSISYAANGINNRWCSLTRAAVGADDWIRAVASEAAQPGDVVLVYAGTYRARGSNGRIHPAFLPINSGTSGNYIKFEAVGTVRLGLHEGTSGPVIGAYQRHWLWWNGFFVDEEIAPYRADTGPVTMFDSSNIIIENCIIRALPSDIADNHNGIRFNNVSNAIVRGNIIYGVTGSSPSTSTTHNYAGIMMYGGDNILIENNHIFDSNAGMYIKGLWNYNLTIRNNLIHDVRKGIRFAANPTDRPYTNYVYGNVIKDGVGNSTMGINLAEWANNTVFANNTIDNFDSGIYFSSTNNMSNLQFVNNIITNTYTAVNAWNATSRPFTMANNMYFNVTEWAYSGSVQGSIASWQAAVGTDGNSTVSNPLYVDESVGNYRLQSGSPAENAGTDVADVDGDSNTSESVNLGAYPNGFSFVGSPLGASIPSNPTNLRIQ